MDNLGLVSVPVEAKSLGLAAGGGGGGGGACGMVASSFMARSTVWV